MKQHSTIKGYIWCGGHHYAKEVFEEMLFKKEEEDKPSLLFFK